ARALAAHVQRSRRTCRAGARAPRARAGGGAMTAGAPLAFESPECALCGQHDDLVLGGDLMVCRDCIPELAWLCWRCGAEPETEVVTTVYGPELWCKTCHSSVDAVM